MSRWPGRGGGGFTPERYEQVLEDISRGAQGALTKADFEATVRDLLLKDKYLGDLIATDRYAVDRQEAFKAWKASRERVDLAQGRWQMGPGRLGGERVGVDLGLWRGRLSPALP